MEIQITKRTCGTKTTLKIFGDGPVCVDYKWEFVASATAENKKVATDEMIKCLGDFTRSLEQAKKQILEI